MPKTCLKCGAEFTPSKMGRPPMYCGVLCRERSRKITESRRANQRAAGKRLYEKNKDKVLAKHREWKIANPDKPRLYVAAYKKRNPEKIREATRIHHAKNRDVLIEKKSTYRREHPEKVAAWAKPTPEKSREVSRLWQARYRATHLEEHRQKQKEYYHRNPAKYLAKTHRRETRKTNAGGSYTADEWSTLLDKFGHKCLCCGRFGVKLTVDHVIPVSLGGTSNIDNLQPLCRSCNSKKHMKTIDYRGNYAPAA